MKANGLRTAALLGGLSGLLLLIGQMLGGADGLMMGFVLALPMSIFSTYANREGAWLADVVGGTLVGPLVHLAVIYRSRLFLSIHGDPA